MKDEKGSFFERMNSWARNSIGLKLFSIGFLILILLIPSFMIRGLISERNFLHDSAIKEVSSKWGNDQTIIGPILNIPYHGYSVDASGRSSQISYAHFLPETLNINSKLTPEIRHRGIYEIVLYGSDVDIKGQFKFPNLEELGIDPKSVIWNKAFVSFGISDTKGLNKQTSLVWVDKSFEIKPGTSNDILISGVNASVEINNTNFKSDTYDFSLNLNLNGSHSISFLPLGKTTTAKMSSPWTNPSFVGDFLPDKREVTGAGFTADWNVLELNRSYPQKWIGSAYAFKDDYRNYGDNTIQMSNSFGVNLMLPVDVYQKNTRSVKYAVMAIFLTFLCFFFAEIINKKRIHPIQYLLVGSAICLFYLLLLSISEQLSFGYAYLIASIAVIGLITVYCKSVFKNNLQTSLMAIVLTILYGFFYCLLQLQDYSLLIGSLGLFIILAITMYLSRNIDWYGFGGRENQ